MVLAELLLRGCTTHRIPSVSNPPTMTFVFRFIFRFQITKIGRMPNTRSEAALKTEKTIVRSVTSFTGKQDPWPSVKRSQKYGMGLHWKTMKPKYIIEAKIMLPMVIRIAQMCPRRLQIRRRKKPIERRMRREVTM